MSVACALAAVAIVSGCSSGKKAETGDSTTAPAKESVQGLPDKYDPPIKMSFVNGFTGVASYENGDDEKNNPWTRYIRDTYGIDLEVKWAAPLGNLEEKTNLMIASSDLPDFFLASPKQLVQLTKAGLIEDLTDVYNKYAPPLVKQLIQDAGEEPMEAAKLNGRLMGLPFTGLVKESVPVLWVREDWMKKLNLSEPKTMQDVLAMSEAFTNRDPDGNGTNDTFGLPLTKDLGYSIGFMNGFHAYYDIWIKDNSGNLVYSSIQPEMKNALAKLQEMYKSGQLDKEFGVKDDAKVIESIGNNKVGMMFGTMFSAGSPLQKATPNSLWIPLPVPSIDATPAKVQHGLNLTYGFWVVKKGMQHPEAILKMAEAFVKEFYENTSDEVYKKLNVNNVNGSNISHWVQAPVKIYKPFKNADMSTHLEPLLKSDAPATAEQLAKLTPEERDYYGRIQKYKAGDMNYWSAWARAGLNGSGSIINLYKNENRFMADQFFTVPTPAMVQKGANLQKMEMEMMTKIILGAPLDEFDKFVSEWKRLGGDEITKEVNEWYKSR